MSTLFKRLCQTSLTLLAGLSFSLAADKSGVGPNAISLPKGPGAIEGLGESFQPHLNTGTASFGLALKLPPGTAGHMPALGLSYEGGCGNGPLGFGWVLPMSSIQRRSDEGIPTYGEDVGFTRSDTFINELREELVPLTNGFLFCKNEGAFIRYQQVSNYWVGTLPNGTRMEFGLSADARIADPANSNHVFSWLLQKETDTHGNVIAYSYTNFPGSNNLNQKYLAAVAYGPGGPPWSSSHFVSFNYEDRPDWFEDCRSGFIVRTGKRLKQILIGTQGSVLTNHLAGDFNGDGLTDYLDRKYVLDYLNYAGTNSHWSLLAKVTEFGADGTSSLPPATYGYVVSDPPDTLSAAGQIIGGSNEPPVVMDNPAVDFLDLNGDGLPDVLATDPGGGIHIAYINQGQTSSTSGLAIRWKSGVQMDSLDGRAPQFGLQTTTPAAHLADMDGDGLADLAVTALDGSVLYFQNSGHLVWGARQEMSVQDTAPPSPFGNPDVRTADLDFDKRIDIIQSIATGNGADYRIWFNLGNQSYSAAITVPQTAGFMLSSPGVQIADFNGDRVPDIAKINPAFITITAGLGYGRFADPITVPIPDLILDDSQVARATLMDINGDGLADLVLERAAPGELWYWLNLGNYTFSHKKVITGMPTSVGANAVIRWADLNGNGTTDLVYADSTAMPRMQAVDIGLLVNKGATPNLLVSTANGIGRVATIAYQSSTAYAMADDAAGHPWPDLMPNPVQVVASITTFDSLGHQYVTQFRYHNGYYDPVQKQFRGFASAEQIDVGEPSAPTLVTRSFFDTGRVYEAMKGKVLVVSVEQEDGSIFSVTTNLWTIPPVTLYTGSNGTNVVYAHPTGTIKVISELSQGTPRRLETVVAFDTYGNQTTNADYGIVENGERTAFDDERITTTEFAINTEAWMLRHPARAEIQTEDGAVISRAESYYDDESFSGNNFGQVTLGNLTLSRAWIDPTNPAAYVSLSRTKYDSYGNAVSSLDPLAVASGGAVDLTKGHVREMLYDSRFHSYPVTETIHVGNSRQPLTFSATYDEGFGLVTSFVEPNANRTGYGYDAFARLSNTIKPGDGPDYPTTEYDYALGVPFGTGSVVNFIETRQLDQAPGAAGSKRDHYLISRQFTDGLGRTLMSKQEAEPAPGSTTPRVVISGAVLFNARQKPSRALNPCFTLQPGSALDELLAYESIEAPGWKGTFNQDAQLLELNLQAAHQSSIEYDATLRPVRTTNADGSFRRTVHEPLVVRFYDENDTDPSSPFHDTPLAQHRDGLGRVIQTDELSHLHDDGTMGTELSTWSTFYEYDLNDELTRITDSQGNVKTAHYDGLKRNLSMDDPDCGTVTYTYDEASNLTALRDAKGQQTTYTYDGVNRILSEDYHDQGQPFSSGFVYDPSLPITRNNRPDVAYFYDTPDAGLGSSDGAATIAANTKGNLAYAWDLSGEEHTSYDARGRTAWRVKRIFDVGGDGRSLVGYLTAFDYDSLSRVSRMLYPDNDEVRYEYNARSLIARIVGGPSGNIISNIVYSPAGQELQLDYGNNVRTTYSYDPRLRLNRLNTLGPEPSGTGAQSLIDFSYTFDGVSNIKAIQDQRDTGTIPATDPRRNSQSFAYDDLYRLTQVQYNPPNPVTANGGAIDYHYDRIGNLLGQSSSIKQTEKNLPVTDLGQMESGGTLGRTSRVGRQPNDPPGPHALTSIMPSSPAARRDYSYDANGNLMSKDGLACTWDFKNRLVTAENDVMRADYIYDSTDRRIAKKVVWKAGAPDPDNPSSTLVNSRTQTSVYVDHTFEVRNHEQPTKYVFNGSTRLASITGSLSTNARIQRVRLFPGWNLLSLAVDVTNALQQLFLAPNGTNGPGVVQAAYRWDSTNRTYTTVAPDSALPAGTVMWLYTTAYGNLAIVGPYREPTNRQLNLAGDYIPCAGLEAWPLQLSASLSGWMYEARAKQWLDWLRSDLPFPANPPPVLAPGAAMYLRADQASELEVPSPSLRIRYYHQDHLGSSSVVTDAQGALVEESAFHPFGIPRTDYLPRQIREPYQFTQKERDTESGLHYFEARFLAGNLSRFTSPDPKYASPDLLAADELTDFLLNPQKLNLYAYALNNPLKYTDPTGLGPWDWVQENVWIPFKDPVSDLDGWRTVGNVGAGLGVAAGVLTCETGVGCALAAVSLDHLQSDARGTRPLGAQGITALTGSKRAGDIGYAAVGLALGGGTAALKIANVVSKARAARAAAAAVASLEAEAGEAASVAESVPKAWPKTIYEPPPVENPTLPGWQAPGGEFNNVAARMAVHAERQAANFMAAVNATPKSAWIQATLDATREVRMALPTVEKRAEAFRELLKAADSIFGPGE